MNQEILTFNRKLVKIGDSLYFNLPASLTKFWQDRDATIKLLDDGSILVKPKENDN